MSQHFRETSSFSRKGFMAGVIALAAGVAFVGCIGDDGGDDNGDPTAITAQPQGVTATAGEPVTFSVVAEGSNLTYKWVSDATAFGGDTMIDTIAGATTDSLTIENPTAEMHGTVYRAVVIGEDTTVVSGNAILRVNDPAAPKELLVQYGGEGMNTLSAGFENCTGCHGENLQGSPGYAPPLANSDHFLNNRTRVIATLLRGGFADSGGFVANGIPYAVEGGGQMPSFGYLTDFEIAGIVTYIRSVLNDSLVTSCDPYDPNDDTTYDEDGFAFCDLTARDSAAIANDSVAVAEVTAIRDSLITEGLLD